jgi:hypothetical protein
MALVMPTLADGPAFDGMAVEDEVDIYVRTAADAGTFVISGCTVLQNPLGPNMQIIINSGVVSVNNVQYQYPGTGINPLTINNASAGDRRDTVVLRVVQSATPYVQATVVTGTVPAGLVGAWTRNTAPTTALPPVKGPLQWPSATPQTSVDASSDVVIAEVYVPFNATQILGTALSIINPTSGNIVDKTSQSLNLPMVTQNFAWQDGQRRGGNIGASTSADASAGYPYGQIEITVGDSIATFTGSSTSFPRSWYGLLGVWENRKLGLVDPHQVGFQYPTAFTSVGVNLTTVQGLVKNSYSAGAGVQLTGSINSQTVANSLTDGQTFSRAIIFYQVQSGSDGIGVSVLGVGGASIKTIDANVASTPGNGTVSFYDTGTITAASPPFLSLWRATHVSGAGNVAPIVLGVLYYPPGLPGTQGLSVLSLGEGGLTSADYAQNLNGTWVAFLKALGTYTRRIHICLGGNDIILARSITDASFNNSNVLNSTSQANFGNRDIGRPVTGNTNIPAGTTIIEYLSSTQVLMSNAATGGNLSSQSVTLGQIPPATTYANLTSLIQRLRQVSPIAEIAFYAEYQPYSGYTLDVAGMLSPTSYSSSIIPMYQSVATTNKATYVGMHARFGSVSHRLFTDASLAAGSPFILSTTAAAQFGTGDLGAAISGPGIPNGTTILWAPSNVRAVMSNAASTAVPAPATITSTATAIFVATCQCVNTFKTGDSVLISGLSAANGYVVLLSATSTQFTFSTLVNVTGSGTATPAYVVNNDTYTLSFDLGLHFGDSTNNPAPAYMVSAGYVDGQRARAAEAWERLGYAADYAIAPTTFTFFTPVASGQWICPVTGIYFVRAVGAGGGGGGGAQTTASNTEYTGGGGGGSAATAEGYFSCVANVSYAYSVGQGGNGGPGKVVGSSGIGGVGGNGGSTTFTAPADIATPSSVQLVALGGGGGGNGLNASTALTGVGGGFGGAYTGTWFTVVNVLVPPPPGYGGIGNVFFGSATVGGGPVGGAGGAGGGAGPSSAVANLGGTGGGAGTQTAGGTGGALGGSATAAGGIGGTATAPGAGGGGGGAGNNNGGGGNGGAGGPGALYIQKVG